MEPTAAQLRYLTNLGYSGPKPRSRAHASSIIEAIKKAGRAEPPGDTSGSLNNVGTGKERMPTMAEREPWEQSALEKLRRLNQKEY